jgi:putative tricarboxylic transport membrane protein
MEAAKYSKGNAYLLVGAMGLAAAVGYLTMALRLPFGQLDQPGAAVFPIFVATVLAIASLATIQEGWSTNAREKVEFPVGGDRRRVVYLVLLLLGFFFALPWLGQLISSTLFCVLLMRVLSAGVSWVRILAYSVVLAVAIDLVFERLLKVPLPHGVLGL